MGDVRGCEGNLRRLTSHRIRLRYPILAVSMHYDILIRGRHVFDGDHAAGDGSVD
jgi:hypothetical protein